MITSMTKEQEHDLVEIRDKWLKIGRSYERIDRKRSADSTMARVEIPSTRQQAGYMYASLPTAPSKKALAYGAGPYMPPKHSPKEN